MGDPMRASQFTWIGFYWKYSSISQLTQCFLPLSHSLISLTLLSLPAVLGMSSVASKLSEFSLAKKMDSTNTLVDGKHTSPPDTNCTTKCHYHCYSVLVGPTTAVEGPGS